MTELLTVALESDKLQASLFNPTGETNGIQLHYATKGVIIEIAEMKERAGYTVRLMEMPQGQQRPTLKASRVFLNGADEVELCKKVFDKYFSDFDMDATASHYALLINGKKPELNATKGGK